MNSITETPGVCGGEPCLAGTRITMSHLQRLVELGWDYERILREYPHLDRQMFLDAMSLWINATDWRETWTRIRIRRVDA